MVMQATLFAGEAPPRCQIAIRSFVGSWTPGTVLATNFHTNPFWLGPMVPTTQTGFSSVDVRTYTGTPSKLMAHGTTTTSAGASYRLNSNASRPATAPGDTRYGQFTVYNPNAWPLAFACNLRSFDTSGSTVGTQLESFTSSYVVVPAGGSATLSLAATFTNAATLCVALTVIRGSSANGGAPTAADEVFVDSCWVSDQPVQTVGVFSGATADVVPTDPYSTGLHFAWAGTTNNSRSSMASTTFTPEPTVTFSSLSLYRDGVLTRKQPQVGQVAAVVDDYEFNRQVDVVYRLDYAYSNAPSTILSESLTINADIGDGWLIHPTSPALSLRLSNIDETSSGLTKLGQATRGTTRTVHDIIAASLPVATSTGKRKSVARTIEIETVTGAQLRQLLALFDNDQPVLFLIPGSWAVQFDNGWYSVGDIDEIIPVDVAGYDYRSWSLPVQQVAAPITVVESLWSRQALMDAGYTRQQLPAVWATRLDLMQNRRSA